MVWGGEHTRENVFLDSGGKEHGLNECHSTQKDSTPLPTKNYIHTSYIVLLYRAFVEGGVFRVGGGRDVPCDDER